jgi:alkylation response protein AidB-like acyl-CoA dehydrogenase
MTVHAFRSDGYAAHEQLLDALQAALPNLASLACTDDRAARFPEEAMAILRDGGLLSSVLPFDEGGAGLGTDRRATTTLLRVLTRLGAAHLSLARLFEGHVNAFALLWQYGSSVQRLRLMRYVQSGGVMGVWNAPAPEGPLRLLEDGEDFQLSGTKIYASGAGAIVRPLLTAITPDGRLLMVWCDVTRAAVDLSDWQVLGMKATATGSVRCDGVPVARDELFGTDQDYHRQPAFSGGAWRFVAAQLGAAGALVDLVRAALLAAGRDQDPHQRARLAEAVMQLETGRLWTEAAARLAEDPSAEPADVISYVGMARLVVEQASMSIMALAQRSVGLRSMMEGNPIERICRDLATYLRQPVPDAIRDGAAASALASSGPALERWTP